MEKDKIKTSMIKLDINPDFKVYPISRYSYSIALHSPNTFAEEKDFTMLDIKQSQFYSYSQINTELQGYGYDTNCFDYDIDYKFQNFDMRYDCILNCVSIILNQFDLLERIDQVVSPDLIRF